MSGGGKQTAGAPGQWVTREQTVRVDPWRVWGLLTDLPRYAAALRQIQQIEQITGGPYEVGTRWYETRRLIGRDQTRLMRVTAVSPGHRLVLTARDGRVDYTTTYTLAAIAHTDLSSGSPSTRLVMTVNAEQPDAPWLDRLGWLVLGSLADRAAHRSLRLDLVDLAAAAERGKANPS